MSTPKIVVVGGNFAGLTGALELKDRMDDNVDVTVISKSDKFVFTPSQIWIPFGWRKPSDITFPLAPVFEDHHIHFLNATVDRFDTSTRKVIVGGNAIEYDYLLIATGPGQNYDVVPGLGPDRNSHNIVTMQEALAAGEAFKRLLDDPGPVVIGAVQGAGCFGAAYEFLFNFAHALRKHRMASRCPVTFVTSEPFVGHFGIGGLKHGEGMLKLFMKSLKIDAKVGVAVEEVLPNGVKISDGTTLASKYTMLIPPFTGVAAIQASPGLGDANGLIPVRPTYGHQSIDRVYAAGVAVQVLSPWHTPISVGVPKTGYPAETMAKIAAHNIAAQILGEVPNEHEAFGDIPAICVLDAGNLGVIILADKMLPPRRHQALIPGPQAHWAKLAFEKYFLWKMKHGYVGMP